MSMWHWFRSSRVIDRPMVRVPLTPAEADAAKATFQYLRAWRCACGAALRIRARESHADGPSNYVADAAGHSQVSPDLLTWNGLARERGWLVDGPVRCPACQRGMTRAAYKAQGARS